MEEIQASKTAEIEACIQEHIAKLNEMSDHSQTAEIEACVQEHVAKT